MDYSNFNTNGLNLQDSENHTHYHNVLLELKQMDKTDLHKFMKKVLTVVADALDIERVSIWFFNAERDSIYCDYLYLKKFGEYINESALYIKDHPKYFDAINSRLYLAANDAVNDESTSELTENYLKPRGILSMLDIPVYLNGETIGIICHEEQDKMREWKREEIDFTTAIATLLSTALEIDFGRNKEKDFIESQRFLQTLISNLPGYVYRVNKEGDTWSIQYISDGVYDLTGHKPGELIKNKVLYYSMMVNDEDREIGKQVITSALLHKEPYQISYRINTAENKIKWVWEQGRGVYNENSELIATEGFITDITEKKLFEEELIKKNNELSVLYQFGRSLSRLQEPDKLLDEIGSLLLKLFGHENIYLALYDEKSNMISYPFYYLDNERIQKEPRLYGSNFSEFVLRTRKSIILNENTNASFLMMGVEKNDEIPKSIIAAPLLAGDKALGVLTIQDFKSENAFTQNQLDLLTTISSQAAISLENSYLYTEVTKSLNEKEHLLQEVHHRVKNNLQVMSSLIKLQSRYIKDENTLELLKETGGRIQSMAIVHTKVYNSKDYEFIQINEYIKSLLENIQLTYGFKLRNVKFDIDIDDFKLNIDTAIPCGLIINELLSNAVKYAFPGNRAGNIIISIKHEHDNYYRLIFKDDGIGALQGEELIKSDSLGIQLINLLSRQLNGTLVINTEKDKGTEFNILFEEAVYKSRK